MNTRNMKRRSLVAFTSISLALVACVSQIPPPTRTATPLPSFSLDHFARRPDEMAGGLTLRIESLTPGCSEFGKPVDIRFIFNNLSDSPLVLYKGFKLSLIPLAASGYVAAQIQNSNGVTITYGPSDAGRRLLFASPADFAVVQPESSVELILEYDFPTMDSYPTPLPSDLYQISFVYENIFPGANDPADIHKFFDQGAWMGTIESNQIEVCMTRQ